MCIHRLELPSPRRLLVFRERAHDILALVPLTALHGDLTEDIAYGGTQPFRAVEHHQHRPVEWEAALPQLAEEAGEDAPVLARRLHEAQDPLLPRRRHSEREYKLIPGERLAVEHHH